MAINSFCVVPHTHWDREWYEPFEHFQLALGRVVDEVIEVLEQDSEFTSFTLDGQAIVLEDYLEVRPENEDRLRALLAAGRLEVGPSYVLPDEFLVGAEPLVRNLLIGQAVCRRFGASPSPAGYLPDSFGHPLQIPQILAGFGIDTLIFSRGMGDELDDLGAVFRWRAPDGSDVLAFQLLDHYGNFAFVSDAERGERRVHEILERFGRYMEPSGVTAVLLCNGTDHVPITPGLPGLCRELESRLPGARFTISTYAGYVADVGQVDAPAWSGELLGSRIQNVLRGVNSARLYVKQANQAAERSLIDTETLATLRALHDGTAFPRAELALAWRQLLRCQPHDTICGCSCDAVHRDAMARYESLERTLAVIRRRSLAGLETGEPDPHAVGVLNLLPYRRGALVEAPGRRPAILEVEGFGVGSAVLAPVENEELPWTVGDAIENGLFRIEAGPDGSLSVVDKVDGRRYGRVHVLEDEPDMGDLYNFCPVPDASRWRADRARIRVRASGPDVAELEVSVEAERPAALDDPGPRGAPLKVTTVVRLIRGSRRVEFRTTIENGAEDHRLRVGFPGGEFTDPVRAETAFGVAHRPAQSPVPRARWVEPPDATQHTLGAVAWGDTAVFTKGLPEYEAGADGLLWLTLLRCVGVISKEEGALTTRPHTAGPQVATPEGQCLGRHRLEYAFLPGGGALDDTALLVQAQDYRHGFMVITQPVSLGAGVSLEGELVFSCLKGAEDGDGLILRCFNPAASDAVARVVGPVSISRTRLDETNDEPLPDGTFPARGGEIVTLRLRPLENPPALHPDHS